MDQIKVQFKEKNFSEKIHKNVILSNYRVRNPPLLSFKHAKKLGKKFKLEK